MNNRIKRLANLQLVKRQWLRHVANTNGYALICVAPEFSCQVRCRTSIEDHNLVPMSSQMPGNGCPYEPRCACDQDSHVRTPSAGSFVLV